MAEVAHRTCRRDAWGAQAVRSKESRDNPARSSRRHDDHDKQRSRHGDTPRSPKQKSSSRRQSQRRSEPEPVRSDSEKAVFELRVVRQPKSSVQFGGSVEQHVIVNTKSSTSGKATNVHNIDTSTLFAVTSLVADTRTGERTALEPGSLTGQNMLGSVRQLPEHVTEDLVNKDPTRRPLGYFSFPDLFIRQHGTSRIRTTLVMMGSNGAISLHAVDSEPIKVDNPLMSRCNQRL